VSHYTAGDSDSTSLGLTSLPFGTSCTQDLRYFRLHTFALSRFTTMLLSPLPDLCQVGWSSRDGSLPSTLSSCGGIQQSPKRRTIPWECTKYRLIVPDNQDTRRVMTLAPQGQEGAVWMMGMRSPVAGTFRWRLQSNRTAHSKIITTVPPKEETK